MTFFLSNAIETHLITTGAFEIFMNGNIFDIEFIIHQEF